MSLLGCPLLWRWTAVLYVFNLWRVYSTVEWWQQQLVLYDYLCLVTSSPFLQVHPPADDQLIKCKWLSQRQIQKIRFGVLSLPFRQVVSLHRGLKMFPKWMDLKMNLHRFPDYLTCTTVISRDSCNRCLQIHPGLQQNASLRVSLFDLYERRTREKPLLERAWAKLKRLSHLTINNVLWLDRIKRGCLTAVNHR